MEFFKGKSFQKMHSIRFYQKHFWPSTRAIKMRHCPYLQLTRNSRKQRPILNLNIISTLKAKSKKKMKSYLSQIHSQSYQTLKIKRNLHLKILALKKAMLYYGTSTHTLKSKLTNMFTFEKTKTHPTFKRKYTLFSIE